MPLVLAIGGLLAWDRYLLCKQYLFKYTDEDQTCMWYAAHDLLNGRIAEPAFYGQDYNSCMEGYLAAPLVAMGMPYHVACPLTTVILGLLPFLLLAFVAWRRGHSVMAGAALLIPLLMPVRYGMICGIPRGFITGIAVAIFPAILLLPPPNRRMRLGGGAEPEPRLIAGKKSKWLRRSWPAPRYFFAAALSVIALQVNPSGIILLVPVAVYALLTTWREWQFWVFGLAGLIAAAPYPIYVYQFYYVYHPDYVFYLRGNQYEWGFTYYLRYLNDFVAPRSGPSLVLADMVPFSISGTQAPVFIVLAFSVVGALLLVRKRSAALLAGFAGVLIILVSFGYERVRMGTASNTASYSYSRMFLCIPVLFVWLLFLVNHKPMAWFHGTALGRWFTRGALVGLLLAGYHALTIKEKALPGAITAELQAGGIVVCPAVPIDQFYATAREIEKAAKQQHADLLIVGGGDRFKHLAYAIPAVLGIETIYPNFERRTFRMIEEYSAKHESILLINFNVSGAVRAGGGNVVVLDADGNPVEKAPASSGRAAAPSAKGIHSAIIPTIYAFPTRGQNAYDTTLSRLLPPLMMRPTPGNDEPTLQVYRSR